MHRSNEAITWLRGMHAPYIEICAHYIFLRLVSLEAWVRDACLRHWHRSLEESEREAQRSEAAASKERKVSKNIHRIGHYFDTARGTS